MMKKAVTICLLLLIPVIAAHSQVVVPLQLTGEVYSFEAKLNGKSIPTVISSSSCAFIPMPFVQEMYDEGLLCGADFKGFKDTAFVQSKIMPGVAVNIREMNVGGKVFHDITAFITGSVTPFFSIGQLTLRDIGYIGFEEGKLFLSDDTRSGDSTVEVVSPDIVWDTNTVRVKQEEEFADPAAQDSTFNDQPILTPQMLYDSGCVYYGQRAYREALARFKEAEKAGSRLDTDLKKDLFRMMAATYSKLEKTNDMAKYLKKAIALCDAGEERVLMRQKLVNYYSRQSDTKALEIETIQMLKDYCLWKGLYLDDCWRYKANDETIADAFTMLGRRFESKRFFQKFYTYYYYGAAWGNKDAQERCRKMSVEYRTEPVNKIKF